MALRKITSRKVGKNIKTIRLALHMSQERFGKLAGDYSQDTVAKWESGQVPPALILKRISEISDPPRSVDWILDSRQAPQVIDSKATFAPVEFDALRQVIREEIDAALSAFCRRRRQRRRFRDSERVGKKARRSTDVT
jgi:transcriptional regulator with XRE-family HTH domain